MSHDEDLSATTEELAGANLLVIATGSISAAFLPYWVNWMRAALPRTGVRLVLTPTGARFVSAEALAALLGAPVETDSWQSGESAAAPHVDLASWADCVLVHPCTFSYLARLAQGSGDSPSMLALQSTRAPVVLCPALPPGAADGWAYRQHLAALEDRGTVTVLPPVPARSVTTRERDAGAPALFPAAVEAVALARRGAREGGTR